jgi:hypothetical protein
VGSRAGLDKVVRRKIPSLPGTRTPDDPARSPALSRIFISYNGQEKLASELNRECNKRRTKERHDFINYMFKVSEIGWT